MKSGIGEVIKIVVQALVLALLVRTVLYQPFSIPSGSMIRTLLINDYLFVSKFSYGYSRYSLPYGNLLPSFGRVWAEEPERGDIAVFKWPADGETDYIKRVIGIPGDRIQMKSGQIFINDVAVPREKTDEYVQANDNGNEIRVDVYRETLPNGVSYDTLDLGPGNPADDTRVFEVPAGHFFMMGDNRDASSDSRISTSGVGYVPFENFVGRAEIIFFSIDEDSRPWMIWTWPWTVRWDRPFTVLR